jgi:hypothetical protein
MKCANTKRHESRLVVSFVIKLEWAAYCDKPGVSRRSTTCIVTIQPINLKVLEILCLCLKRPGRKFDHSPPCRAKVKNEWTRTSASTVFLDGVHSDKFII